MSNKIKDINISLWDHKDLVREFKNIERAFSRAFKDLNKINTSKRIIKARTYDDLLRIEKKVSYLKSRLDTFYHCGITNEQFRKWGHIYYGGNNHA